MATESERSGTGSLARREPHYPSSGGGLFRPFALLREMTDWMDQAFMGGLPSTGERMWVPAVEVRERDNNVVVCADLPGIDKNDLKVEVEDHMLVIQGERKRERTEEREGLRRSERAYGTFWRSIPLPEGAKPEQAKADFRNGVLEITMPLAEGKSHRRQIPIQAK